MYIYIYKEQGLCFDFSVRAQYVEVERDYIWIFLTVKSPNEWVIMKQACRDESIASLFFYLSQYIYYWDRKKIRNLFQ